MILTSELLPIALARTVRPIALLTESDEKVRDLTPDEAAVMLATSTTPLEAGGSKRRVVYLRPVDKLTMYRRAVTLDRRTPNVHDASFWSGRGCLRFWADQRTPQSV